MGFLLQTISIGSVCFVAFLALYFVLILISNFIQTKKNKVKSFDNRKDIITFSNSINDIAKSY